MGDCFRSTKCWDGLRRTIYFQLCPKPVGRICSSSRHLVLNSGKHPESLSDSSSKHLAENFMDRRNYLRHSAGLGKQFSANRYSVHKRRQSRLYHRLLYHSGSNPRNFFEENMQSYDLAFCPSGIVRSLPALYQGRSFHRKR